MYSTLTLEKEREIVKEETAFRKEKEAVHVQDKMAVTAVHLLCFRLFVRASVLHRYNVHV